jgi:hypothetical protein
VTALDTQAMTLGSDGEPMALGYANELAGAPPPAYGPGLVFWTNAFGAWADFDGNKNAASADRNLGGFVSGNGCARHSLLAARRCYWGIVLRHLGRCTPTRSPQT